MASVPLPARRPKQTERIDGEEDCAECNQSNLEQFFARDVVHAEPSVRKHASLRSLVAELTSAASSEKHGQSRRHSQMSVQYWPMGASGPPVVGELDTDAEGPPSLPLNGPSPRWPVQAIGALAQLP